MENYFKRKNFIFASTLAGLFIVSCQKTETSISETTATPVIAIATSLSTAAASPDSIYVIQPCERGARRDSIPSSSLNTNITNYLSLNYAGYALYKAFAVSKGGIVSNFVVVIYFNDKPVAIEFDATGSFVKVLEQREKSDLDNHGWHRGGRFEERGRFGKDTIALSSLPYLIQTYMAANYTNDTLLKAYRNCDSSYVVLSANNGLFATVFSNNNIFVKRNSLTSSYGNCLEIAESALPSAITTYLSSSYPNYVFKKAFVQKRNAGIAAYIVFIDANNTKYAVEFDSAGNFVKVKIVY